MENPFNIDILTSAEQISMKIDSVYKDQYESVYYKIQLTVDSDTFFIGRRYNQFYEFDKTLKFLFRSVSFPSLPSKYTIFNKVELRRKGFNQYLEDLMSLLKTFTSSQKSEFFKALIEFLKSSRSRAGSTDLEQAKSKKNNLIDPMSRSVIDWDYSGFCQVKLTDWETFELCLKNDTIYLYEASDHSSFKHVFSLVAGRLALPKENILEIHHDNQDLPLVLKSSDYEKLKKALLIATSSNTDSPLSNLKLKAVGRVRLTVHSAGSIKFPKPATSMVKPLIYVSVQFGDFSFQTSLLPLCEEMRWGQTFTMPIFNVFFDLQLSICAVTTEGWIKQHPKVEVIQSIQLPLTDINQKPFSEGTVVIRLNNDKKEDDFSNLVIDVEKNYAFSSHFAPALANYIENSPLPEQASMHELKIAFRRMKRVRILYFLMIKSVFRVFYWIYPDFSKLCLALYCFFMIFVPSQLFLPFFFLMVLSTCLYFNPDLKNHSKKLKKFFFAKKKHIQPYPKVNTIKEELHLKKCEMKLMKEKVKEGVIKRWKKFKEDAVELQNYLTIIACYGEKIRNLFLWEDPEKSLWFCIGLILLIIFFSLIPFRVFLLFAGLYRFYKGYKFTRRRIKNNSNISELVINKLLSKHYPERVIRADSNEKWPKEFKENLNLQKKFVEGIREQLELEVNNEVFDLCQSPQELASFIGSSRVMLKAKDNKVEHSFYSKEKPNLLLSFLSNVPSEYFRLEHPRVVNVESYY